MTEIYYLQLLYSHYEPFQTSVKKMDRTAVLNKMSDMLKLQFNMDYLEWLFDQYRKDIC